MTPQTIYKAASTNNVQLLLVSYLRLVDVSLHFKVDLYIAVQEVLTKVPSNSLYQFLEPQDECGWTPLMVASAKGHTAAAQEVHNCVHKRLCYVFVCTASIHCKTPTRK